MRFRDEWTLNDLKALIDAADSEHVDYEFKACDKLELKDNRKKEAAITTSAFANGTGGVVVYGVREDSEGKYELDSGFEPDGKITKDWLTMVLDTQVQPPIHGLRVFRIEIDKVHQNFALLVQVPRSEIEPHQAPDKRYYLRRDGHNVQMTHQEVKDAFFRARHPNLQVEIELVGVSIHKNERRQAKLVIRHDVQIRNVGSIIASDYLIRFFCDSRAFRIESRSAAVPGINENNHSSVISSTVFLPQTDHRKPAVQTQRKLFPGQSIWLPGQDNRYEVQIQVHKSPNGRDTSSDEVLINEILEKCIRWEIYADSAPKKSGAFRLREIMLPSVTFSRNDDEKTITIEKSDSWPDALCLE